MTCNFQILSLDTLVHLRQHMPKDAFCTLVITREDLYPEESWSFVFGQASLNTGVGVFSFVRYDPAFSGHVRGQGYRPTRRSFTFTAFTASTGRPSG
ncbi:MAG: hypothetical protein M0R18_04235 [Deltaproteobacteria bacterium]|nr:hypothetical protein [Deltaproteobacteria bacterium]HPW67906.1 hypothetical protein [Deltaproteobacteria bacterium]